MRALCWLHSLLYAITVPRTLTITDKDAMRELSFAELSCMAGGIELDNGVVTLVGIISSLAGYEFSINVMQTLGCSDGMTTSGASSAALGGGAIALFLSNNPNYSAGDGIYTGVALSFLCGAGLGIAPRLVQTATAKLIDKK